MNGAWLVLALAGALAAVTPQATLAPLDEAARQPDFLTFRQSLQQAVAAHDVAALLAAIDPNIKVSFGDDNGVDAFKRFWRLEAPDSKIWRELGAVLLAGGGFQGSNTFVAPYVFVRWPERFDAFEHVAVIGRGVRIRGAASLSGRQIATVSYAILEAPAGVDPEAEWTAVTLADGRSGFIASRLIRSPVGYRAFFVKGAAGWRLSMFVAGD
jgi:hypothetical protein